MAETSSSRTPLLLAAAAVALLIGVFVVAQSRSGDAGDSDDNASSNPTVEGDDSDGGVSEEASSVTASPTPTIALPSNPVDGDLVYSCAGRRFEAAELVAALASDGVTSDDLAAAGHDLDLIGDPASWALTSSGVAIATTPIATDPPALALAEPGQAPFACIAIRAGNFEGRPVAWERVGDDIVVESCVSADALVVDTREIDGAQVLAVFAPADDGAASADGACRLNGDVVLAADADAELSSLTFPFIAARAQTWEVLGFGVGVAPLDAATVGTITCAVTADTTEVFVEWSAVPPGFDVTVIGDDQDLFTAERTAFEESTSFLEAFSQLMSDIGAAAPPELPSGFTNGFSDFTAPLDGVRAYDIRIDGGGIEPVVVGCGEAGLLPGGPTATTQPQGANVSGDLDGARELFQTRAVSPYGYLRVVGICGSCDGAATELVLQPSSASSSVSLDFSPPLSEQASSGLASVMVNPFILHDTLIAAVAEGRDVTYTLDPSSGVPIEWTIDGEGARIECFEVDTAPPDLRANDSCSTDLDLIGS